LKVKELNKAKHSLETEIYKQKYLKYTGVYLKNFMTIGLIIPQTGMIGRSLQEVI
tara:strand:- start:297 stop:461 length:165 start_codon:yes stop_codon:yes gene_type:complete